MQPSSFNTTPQQPAGVISQGIELGGTAGCLGASGYLLLYLLLPLLGALFTPLETWSLTPIAGWLVMLMISLLFGSIVGVLPAVIIGVVTGAVIGVSQRVLNRRLTRARARVLGVVVCGGLAALVHGGLWWWHILPRDTIAYAMLLGVPTVVYASLGAWLSGRLFAQMHPGVKHAYLFSTE